MFLKITIWNLKHASEFLENNPSSNFIDRIKRVRESITEIDPNILLIVEGPKGEQAITDFSNAVRIC